MSTLNLGKVKGTTWYTGTAITGTETTGTVFADSGVEYAIEGDFYVNTDTGYFYICSTPGEPDTAEWEFLYDAMAYVEEQATAASASATAAASSATDAATSATNAAASETSAATSATEAEASATEAATSETAAEASATAAASSATEAAESQTAAAESATAAGVSESECREMVESLTSVYRWKGSCAAADLPSDAEVGDVWNLTDDSEYGQAGMNVGWTGESWDSLGGSWGTIPVDPETTPTANGAIWISTGE